MLENKNAILFYNKVPMSFSEYVYFQAGTGYIALCEKSDNVCILCRILDDKEIAHLDSKIQRLVIKCSNGSVQEHHVVIIKRELQSIEEVKSIMNKYTSAKYSYNNMRVFEY